MVVILQVCVSFLSNKLPAKNQSLIVVMNIDKFPPGSPSFTSDDVFQKASELFLIRGMNPVWENGIEYALAIKYQDFETILLFEKDRDSINILIHSLLEDKNDEDAPSPCLQIVAGSYTKEDGQITTEAYIEHIIAGQCKIPAANAGTWLMRLANKILCILGIQENHLLDLSSIACKGSNKYARLIFLNVYKGKYKSWYENFGYKSREDKSVIISVMKELRNMDAKNIGTELSEVTIYPIYSGYYNLDEEKQKVRDILHKYSPDNQSLGEYMSKLWDKDCALYSVVDSFLLRTRGSWEKKIQFLHGTGIMNNYNVC